MYCDPDIIVASFAGARRSDHIWEILVAHRAGAEAWSAPGGRVGVLLCHGLTGSPASLRPMAQTFAGAGHRVELPLLPGHGTRWQDLQQTRWPDWFGEVESSFGRLRQECDDVFVVGLSMGGALALRLAQTRGDDVSGVVVVNPSVHSRNKMLPLLPALRHIISAVPGISNDIKRTGQDEVAYDRLPLQAMYSLTKFWGIVRDDLTRVTQPLLVFGSVEDHVVEPSNALEVLEQTSSEDCSFVALQNSYHVATLDNDADLISNDCLDFFDRIAKPRSSDPASESLNS